jgi:hypothetical protein
MGEDLIQPSAAALQSEWRHSFGAYSPWLALPQFIPPGAVGLQDQTQNDRPNYLSSD